MYIIDCFRSVVFVRQELAHNVIELWYTCDGYLHCTLSNQSFFLIQVQHFPVEQTERSRSIVSNTLKGYKDILRSLNRSYNIISNISYCVKADQIKCLTKLTASELRKAIAL